MPYWVILVTQDEPGRVWTGLGGSGQVWIQVGQRSNGQSALAPDTSLHSSYWVILVIHDEPGPSDAREGPDPSDPGSRYEHVKLI
jgi:hypothetical protein